MVFRIIISPRAQNEVDHAINDYFSINHKVAKKFILELEKLYNLLSKSPYFAVRYKDVRSIKITGFPYTLFFKINENSKTLEILSCFHNKLSPKKRP